MALLLSPKDHFSLSTSLIFRMDSLSADISAPLYLLGAQANNFGYPALLRSDHPLLESVHADPVSQDLDG